MPKKRTSNRLDKLFDGIQEEVTVPAQKSGRKTAAQSVEKKPSARPAKAAPKSAGRASALAQTSALPALESVAIAQRGGADVPASMSLAFQIDNRNWATLQVVDEAATRDWDQNEQMLVKQVADQLSQALENAHLFQETRSRAEELAVLNEMNRALTSMLDVEAVIESLYQYASRLIDTNNFFVALYTEEGEVTFPLAFEHGQRRQWAQRQAGQGLTEHIIHTREPLLIEENVMERMKELNIESIGEPALSWLGVPMTSGETVIGVIAGQSYTTPRLYNERHRDLLSAIAGQAAIAIQNARLFEETQRRTQELGTLNELAQRLSARLDVNQVLQEIYRGVSRLIDAKNFYIGLYTPEKNEIAFPLNVTESIIDQQIVTIRADQGLTGHILKTRTPLVIQENMADALKALGIEAVGELAMSWLGVPLLLGDQVIGAMAVQSFTQAHAYDEHARDLLLAFAGQAAISIQNARLFSETERRSYEISTLAEIANDIATSHEIQPTLESIARHAAKYLEVEDVAIFLTEPNGQMMRARVATGKYEQEILAETLYLGKGIAGIVAQTGVAEIVNAPELDPRSVTIAGTPDEEENPEILMVAPVILRGNVIGVINVWRNRTQGPFTENDLNFLINLAGQAAIAIDSTSLFAEVQHRNEQLDILNKVVTTATQSLDLKAVLSEVLREVFTALHFDAGLVTIFNERRGKLERAIRINMPGESPEDPAEGLKGSLCEVTFLSGQTQVSNDLRLYSPADAASSIEAGLYGYLGIPVFLKGAPIGTLCVFRKSIDPIPEDTITLAHSIGIQIGFAVENARLFERTQASEMELRALFAAMTDVIIVYNKEGRYMRIAPTNPSRLFLPPEDMLGKKIADVLPPEVSRSLMDAIEKSLETSGTVKLEYPLQINQREYWFDGSVSKLSENEVFLVARDITDRRLNEEALKRRNEYLSATAEIGQLVTSTLDLPTLFSRTVNLVRDRFGFYHSGIFVTEETGFKAVLQAATGEAGAEMMRQKHSLQVGSKSIVGEVTESGRPVVVNDTAASTVHKFNPLLPETRAETAIPLRVGTRIIGALDIQSTSPNAFSKDDITVLQTLTDQIAIAIDNARSYELSMQAVKEMREADRLKSQFLANMSHELRTPLNSIIGFSRVILKGIDGPTTDLQQQDLLAIHNSGQHLLGLINDILDISRIEAGKMELTFDEVNLPDLITSVMSTVSGLVKDKPITLHRDLPDDLPTVRADAMRIRQILLNLLSNAAKFTDEGSITVKASVQDNVGGRPEITVSVTDSGPGISPEDQKKLFQPFSQVDASPTRKSGGSGLGLSISSHLVEMHGGRIGVESATGAGSTFYFTLPAFRGESEAVIIGGNKIILAIDDDPQVVSLYERYLQPQGYQVVALSDPSRAVERVRQLKPYAVTLDIMMPGYDGWRVLNDLKSDASTRDVPVIVCSIVEEHEKGFSLGAADYLVKPILEDDILDALDRLNVDGSIREVLIIDDDPNDLRLMGRMLAEHGRYHPTLVESGRNGWEAILANMPHAVVLDLFMPDMDGFTIIEKMRSNEKLRDVPVVVVSGGDLSAEQQQKLQDFGQRMIQKNGLNERQLIGSLERVLKRVKK